MTKDEEIRLDTATSTELSDWVTALLEENKRLREALREMQEAAATALEMLGTASQDGPVGDFLITIHRHCASHLQIQEPTANGAALTETQP